MPNSFCTRAATTSEMDRGNPIKSVGTMTVRCLLLSSMASALAQRSRLALIQTAMASGQAQVSSGDIKGTVTDASGAVLKQAKITVTDRDRGLTRNAESNDAGEFLVPLLPPGHYRIRIEAPGFGTKTLENV